MQSPKPALFALAICALVSVSTFLPLTGLDGSHRADAPECGVEEPVYLPYGEFRLARAALFRSLNAAASANDAAAYRRNACVLEALARRAIGENALNADAWMTLADARARANEISGTPPLDDVVRQAFANARAFGRREYPVISRRVEFLAFYGGEDAALGQLLDEEVNVFLQYSSLHQAMNYLCFMTMEMGEAETARVRGAVERMRPDLLPTFDNVLWRMREGTYPNMPRA